MDGRRTVASRDLGGRIEPFNGTGDLCASRKRLELSALSRGQRPKPQLPQGAAFASLIQGREGVEDTTGIAQALDDPYEVP
jgi:hypothetical protein